MPEQSQLNSICNYFVDEAGDGTLFNRRGKVIIGTEGCSNYFMMGLLEIPNPDQLSTEFSVLRQELLSDPYFKKVPSMQPGNKKTAISFHAKDDIPEVRRSVFNLLRKQTGLRFFAVVKDKHKVLEYIQNRQERETSYRYHPNELYDFLVRRLFKGKLHKADGYNICFAKRGNSKRTKALKDALEIARSRSLARGKVAAKGLMNVTMQNSTQQAGLQAVDYFLWTLQRFYERREDRYLEYLWGSFRLIIDSDDTRKANSGVYYTQRLPLTLSALPEEIK